MGKVVAAEPLSFKKVLAATVVPSVIDKGAAKTLKNLVEVPVTFT